MQNFTLEGHWERDIGSYGRAAGTTGGAGGPPTAMTADDQRATSSRFVREERSERFREDSPTRLVREIGIEEEMERKVGEFSENKREI